jgi:hypothetical protein
MPLITITAAVTALWTGLEVVGQLLRDEAAKETLKPVSKGIADWIQEKTGWKDKKRESVFLRAYHEAEAKLIHEIGFAAAYRVFRKMPHIVDSPERRERLVLDILENDEPSQKPEADTQNLELFAYQLRKSLWKTETFRPLIEFYALEEAQNARKRVLNKIQHLTNTVDTELRAMRVVMIEPEADYEAERQTYLKQVEAFFEEQEFVGFPELREYKSAPLLKDIYVPLKIEYTSGGESLSEKLRQLAAKSRMKGEE